MQTGAKKFRANYPEAEPIKDVKSSGVDISAAPG